MTDIFKEILPSIMQNDKDVLDNEKDYKPYLINKALSYHYDASLQANEMNRYPSLPVRMQYDYLRNNIRKYKRRYQPWTKFDKKGCIEIVMEYYQVSYTKAKDMLELLTSEQFAEIEKRLDKGGTK